MTGSPQLSHRQYHAAFALIASGTATLLGAGNVLLTGFRQECKGCGFKPSNAAVLYEVGTNTYAFTGGMNSARVFDSAVRLPNVGLWRYEYDFEWRNTG